jgi:hypothetical protein
MGLIAVIVLFTILSFAWADIGPYIQDVRYDHGNIGPYPSQSYKSSQLVSPRVNILKDDPRCRDGSHIFFNPRGGKVASPGPMIVEEDGTLVWASQGYANSKNTYGLDVQEYRGEKYLTFWAGDDGVRGHGEGMLHRTRTVHLY